MAATRVDSTKYGYHSMVPSLSSVNKYFWGIQNPVDGSAQAHLHCQMSKVLEVVEWSFINILAQWSFLDFRVAMKIFQSHVAKCYIVTALLVTIGTCFYGNQTMIYFICEAILIHEH